MAIIDTISGWQVEEDDFIVYNGEEVEVKSINDDEPLRLFTFYSHSTGDQGTGYLVQDDQYDIWGE